MLLEERVLNGARVVHGTPAYMKSVSVMKPLLTFERGMVPPVGEACLLDFLVQGLLHAVNIFELIHLFLLDG